MSRQNCRAGYVNRVPAARDVPLAEFWGWLPPSPPPQPETSQLAVIKPEVIPERTVSADNLAVVTDDVTLVAYLSGTFALCFYDAVHESGGVVHLRIVPPGRVQEPDVTDTTLATDLLLLDRCMVDLRAAEPRAQHWQAKLVAHLPEHDAGRQRFVSMRALLDAFLHDADVKLVSVDECPGAPVVVRFRPTMGQVRTEAFGPVQPAS